MLILFNQIKKFNMKRILVVIALFSFFSYNSFAEATMCRTVSPGVSACTTVDEVKRDGIWYDACCCHFDDNMKDIGCQDNCEGTTAGC